MNKTFYISYKHINKMEANLTPTPTHYTTDTKITAVATLDYIK